MVFRWIIHIVIMKMKSHPTFASIRRNLTSICCMFGMLLSFSALSLAPLPAQAKAGPADDRIDNCNWNRPGVNPFMGDVVAAVDRYPEIPAQVRERLKQRMRDRNFDEFVTISRDAISGKNNYDARISDMHFGSGRVCRQVSRAGWTAEMKERGLVYCEQGHCILVPTICRNVSRISRAPGAPAQAGTGAAGAPPGAAPSQFAAMPGTVESAPATPFEELRPGSASLDGTAPSTVAGDPLGTPGWIGGAGPVATASGGPGSTGNPGVGSGINPTTGTPTITPPTPLSPVPEAQSWAMMLAGLACIAFLARRKQTAA